MNARRKLVVDLVLLSAAGLTGVSGLILVFPLHLAQGHFHSEAFGLSHWMWLNIHRFGAILTLAAGAVHAASNSRSAGTRILRVLRGQLAPLDLRELVFYATMALVCLSGFSAWLVTAEVVSPLEQGSLDHLHQARQGWIHLHVLASLLSLYLTARHVHQHRRGLSALPRREGAPMSFLLPLSRGCQTPFIAIDLRSCSACECYISACPQGVLGLVAIGPHRHVRVDRGGDCQGCHRCVGACTHGAIKPIAGSTDQRLLGSSTG